jgi:N-acyl-D-aspartate/D-glutamate deacylase
MKPDMLFQIKKIMIGLCLLVISIANRSCDTMTSGKKDFDVVILNGRLIDPASGFDGIRNIGIRNDRIQLITDKVIEGKEVIDARGLVVSPGFIDIHQHGQDQENYKYKVMDGVTTALELEMGTSDIDKWYSEREGKAIINHGVSIGHVPLRIKLMHDPGDFAPVADAAYKEATEDEIAQLKKGIEHGLDRGGIGVGFGLMYTPAASHWEIIEMFRAAAEYNAPCYVHIRYAGLSEPNSCIAALEEVISAAAVTGAPLHVVHVTSMGFSLTPQMLRMISEARSHGVDVSVECYPYTATQTLIESAVYDGDWRGSWGIDYGDLQWVATGERLTAESFAKYRKAGGLVIAHSIPDEAVKIAIADPDVIIASDGTLTNGKGHPRGAGTFSRLLGKYVREDKIIPLTEGLRKITIMPAQRLEKIAPAFKHKGRICAGADADITIFDPDQIIDQATYEEPARYSKGIHYVLVNGIVVVKEGNLVENVFPGKGVRGVVRD